MANVDQGFIYGESNAGDIVSVAGAATTVSVATTTTATIDIV
ncbi:hypothetical protein Tco_0582416, partial [Tanacetum coccineum]